MALVKCPDCRNDVSSHALTCPRCGCPMTTGKQPVQQTRNAGATPKKRQSGGGLFLVAICTGVIGIFVWPLLIVAGILLLCAVFSTKLECGSCGSKIESRQRICGICNTPVASQKSSAFMMVFLAVVIVLAIIAYSYPD